MPSQQNPHHSSWKNSIFRVFLGLLLSALLLGHSVQLYQIAPITALDAVIYDTHLKLSAKKGVDERIVILDIDEKSLASLGRWPWGRDKLATLVTDLFERYQVAVLGFNVVFAEADNSSGLVSLEAIANTRFKSNMALRSALNSLREALDYDVLFAAAMGNRRVVLGNYFTQDDASLRSGSLPMPALSAGSFREKKVDFPDWPGFGGNLERLQAAAFSAGHFNTDIDVDGIARRTPMLIKHEGEYYESFALAVVRALHNNPPIVPTYASAYWGSQLEWLQLQTAQQKLAVPVDASARSLIPYRGARDNFNYFSVLDVLTGELPLAALAGKIVLIGTTAPGLVDARATPVSSAYPDIEIHANLIAGILDASIKHTPPYLVRAESVQFFLCALLLAMLLPRLSPLRATLLCAGVLLVLFGVNALLWGQGLVMQMGSTLSAIALLYTLNMCWGFFVESRNKHELAELFGHYLPPELVDEMAKNPVHYSMEGKSEQLTVLFADVRGFAAIAEGLPAKELARLVNEYLSAMTYVIQKNRGTLDKYIGDAIMAFWGAPIRDTEHARHAILSALDMQAAAQRLSADFASRGWPSLKIGIGINTGTMIVGDMGSKVRKSYTVIGDAVNLASRLEGITKYYGAQIIVSESTQADITDIVFRELDRVRVKGKADVVVIFEPLGKVGQVGQAKLDALFAWLRALRAYRQRNWNLAEKELQNLQKQDPYAILYQEYRQRIAHYRQHPPPENWDAVENLEKRQGA